jgi:hypothetical protein
MKNKYEWRDGIARVGVKAQIFGPFGVHTSLNVGDGDVYRVTHLATGFSAYRSESEAECECVAEALSQLPFWNEITNGEGTDLVGWDEEKKKATKTAIEAGKAHHAAIVLA